MSSAPHLRRQGSATQLVVDGTPLVVLGGQVHNSSSSGLEYMGPVWDRMQELNCNTAVTPVYWELIEPREGEFDFTLVDGLLSEARERSMRLILLWFATWKNANSTYAPEWVKKDPARFPRAQRVPGRNCGAITCLSDEACRADSKAFAALMKHLREVDSDARTVVAIQVQNETGLLGAARDHCPLAEEAFAAPVPEELTGHMAKHEVQSRPELRALWASAGRKTSGSWAEVFGHGADEVFMAWHVASSVQRVAAAGRAEYGLPMYANVWLVQSVGQEPGKYPSGGPVSRMMDVWHLAASDIFTLAPDIYVPWFAEVCADYVRADNPLLIPEVRRDKALGAKCFYAVGKHDAVEFIVAGLRARVDFLPLEGAPRNVEYLALDEGQYVDGRWVRIRRLNGDEQALRLGEEPCVRRARVHSFE